MWSIRMCRSTVSNRTHLIVVKYTDHILSYKHAHTHTILIPLQFSEHALSLFSSGSLKVPVDSVFSAEDASQAHARMRDNKNIGKIVITMTT